MVMALISAAAAAKRATRSSPSPAVVPSTRVAAMSGAMLDPEGGGQLVAQGCSGVAVSGGEDFGGERGQRPVHGGLDQRHCDQKSEQNAQHGNGRDEQQDRVDREDRGGAARDHDRAPANSIGQGPWGRRQSATSSAARWFASRSQRRRLPDPGRWMHQGADLRSPPPPTRDRRPDADAREPGGRAARTGPRRRDAGHGKRYLQSATRKLGARNRVETIPHRSADGPRPVRADQELFCASRPSQVTSPRRRAQVIRPASTG